MPDKDLRLNSLSRYSKESPRLFLEEHSHCEIPAGCGGVVLRWFNPHRATPLEFWIYVNGDATFAIDGTLPKSARPLLDYGDHVLSFTVSGINPKEGVLMFAAIAESKVKAPGAVEERSVSRTEFSSDADGSWKYTLQAPRGDSWMKAGFDDTGWQSLVLKPIPEPAEKGATWFRHHKLLELGAKGLGIDAGGTFISKLFQRAPSTDQVWIRRVFRVTPPRESAS